MFKTESNLLTIQKFVYLLDDEHYDQFTQHLSIINASLPLKLIEAIRKKLPAFDSHQDLCKKVYGSADKSQILNFNQLSSYTFKLSTFLSQSFPGYLHVNIPRIQNMVNNGLRDNANVLCEAMLEIADRIGDFKCQMWALEFGSQQAFMVKDTAAGIDLNEKLQAVAEKQMLFITMQTELRKAINISNLSGNPDELKRILSYFRHYFMHATPSLRIFGLYAYLSVVYEYSPSRYEEADIVKVIQALDRELQMHSYIAFPFLSDLKGSFGFFKLNSPLTRLNTKDGEKAYEELSQHYNSLKFWRSYLSFWQLHLIAIQVTRLLSAYHNQIHRDDYKKVMTQNDNRWVRSLIEKCDELMNTKIFKEHYEFEVRSLKMMHGALQIIAGGTSHIKKGLHELESLLITYQQVNLRGSTDSVFMCLMIGYFSIKDYEKCVQTYRRYIKVIKGKPGFIGNDLKIQAYYYLSQWFLTNSKQYPVKLQRIVSAYEASSIIELMNQFNIPVSTRQAEAV